MRLSATTHIAASAASIWDVLTDYPDHETWNPFVVGAAMTKPNRLNVMIDPNPEDRMIGCDAAIRRAEPARQLDIDLHFGPAFLLYAKYRATLSPSGGGTLLKQDVRFGGLLCGYYIRRSFLAKMQRGLDGMSAALRQQFEPAAMPHSMAQTGR